MLLEVGVETMDGLAGKPPRLIFFGLLTPVDTYRISLDFRISSASTVPVICLEQLPLFRPTTWFVHRLLSHRRVFSTLSPSVPNVPSILGRKLPGMSSL